MSSQCTDFIVNRVYYPTVVLPFAAGISVLCYAAIFYLYYILRVPVLQRHPTSLVIVHKCTLELIFVLQFLWIPFAPASFFWNISPNSNDDSVTDCIVQGKNIWIFAWLTQFTLLGGELWFGFLSFDLYSALTNPFSVWGKITSVKSLAFRCILSIYLISFIFATFLVSQEYHPGGNVHDINVVYGLSSEPMIWIHDFPSAFHSGLREFSTINWYKAGLFYFWMLIIYVACIGVFFWAKYWKRFDRGLEDTLVIRLESIRKVSTYVLGYMIFWTVCFILQFVVYRYKQGSDDITSNDKRIHTCVVALLASRGLWSLAIILCANWPGIRSYMEVKGYLRFFLTEKSAHAQALEAEVSSEVEKVLGSLEQPDLNFVLRQEILHYTTWGIRIAAEENIRKASSVTSVDRPEATRFRRLSSTAQTSMFFRMSTAGVFGSTINAEGMSFKFRDFNDPSKVTHRTSVSQQLSPFRPDNNLGISANGEACGVVYGGDRVVGGSTGHDQSYYLDNNHKDTSAAIDAAVNKLDLSALEEQVKLTQQSVAQIHSYSMPAPGPGSGNSSSNNNIANSTAHNSWQRQLSENFPSTADGRNSIISAAVSGRPTKTTTGGDNADATLRNQIKNRIRAVLSNHKVIKTAPELKNYSFVDYSPAMFAEIRTISGVSDSDYITSFMQATYENFTDGRSKAFFYYTHDQKFIVKTIDISEMNKLLKILPTYVDHLRINEQSKLARFMGAHSITMFNTKLYFVVMKNLCPHIDEKYDLKGSWVNRHALRSHSDRRRRLRAERFSSTQKKAKAVLFMDNDLQKSISIGREDAMQLGQQIRRDIQCLIEMGIMDYSLLVGVRRRKYKVDDKRSNTHNIGNNSNYNSFHNYNSPENDDISVVTSSSNSTVPTMGTTATPAVSGAAGPATASRQSMALQQPSHLSLQELYQGISVDSVEGPGVYYFGIIDILQEWNHKKRAEQLLKSLWYWQDHQGISALPPYDYAARFLKRAVFDVVEHSGDDDVHPRYRTHKQLHSDLSAPASDNAQINPLLRENAV